MSKNPGRTFTALLIALVLGAAPAFSSPQELGATLDDFREVEGLTLPHQVELEFGARLESMTVVHVDVAPVLDDSSFSPPATAAAGRESEKP